MISVGRIEYAAFPSSHDNAINQLLKNVPDGTSVTANNEIFSHLCSHTDVYLPHWLDPSTGIIHGIWGFPEKETEYVVVDDMHKQDYIGGWWEDSVKNKLPGKYDLILNIDGANLYRLRQAVEAGGSR